MNVIISYQVKISLFYIIYYTWSFMHSVNIISFRLIRRIRVSTKFKDNHSTSAGIRNLVINLRKDMINLRKDLRNYFVILAGSGKGFTFGRVGFYGC